MQKKGAQKQNIAILMRWSGRHRAVQWLCLLATPAEGRISDKFDENLGRGFGFILGELEAMGEEIIQ